MKKIYAFLLAMALVFMLTGCGSKTYQIQTMSGDTYLSETMPEYNKKSDTYTIIDMDDNTLTVNKSEVKLIKEQKK